MLLGALRGRGLPLLWWIAAVLVPGEMTAPPTTRFLVFSGVFSGVFVMLLRCTACSVVLSTADSAGKTIRPKFECEI